ncbi:MAG TPA: phage minor head protein, partial [Vicinamibacterales bacterium]|nr:phage minor head protein [Vicinamibacterales bacterium]
FAPTRDSPEIRSLLTDSFTRLSTNGEVRLRDYLGDIREALVQGALSGDSPLAVAQELSERFDAYNRNEFERLARTEMAFGFNRGILDELRAEGVWGVEILVGAMACPICLVHQGNTFALEDEEGEPLTRLGINVPPYHPNCLCSLVAAEGPASREAPDGGGGSDGSDESGRSDGGR